jgi:hypothetical protein
MFEEELLRRVNDRGPLCRIPRATTWPFVFSRHVWLAL